MISRKERSFITGSTPVSRTKIKTLKPQRFRGFFLLSQWFDAQSTVRDAQSTVRLALLIGGKIAHGFAHELHTDLHTKRNETPPAEKSTGG